MNTRIALILSALSLAGCATGGSSSKSAEVPVPTYTEKAGAVALSDFSGGSCPADGKGEGPDWRKAVGAANASNPISIIVPCLRVVGSNGTLTGYAGGLKRKEWLLRHEASAHLCAAS